MANATLTKTSGGGIVTLEKQQKQAESLLSLAFKRFIRHRAAVFGVLLLTFIVLYVTVGALLVSEASGNQTNIMNKYAAPSAENFFGTDEVGRDVFARTIYGGQISLMIAVAAMLIAISLGTLVGLIAGYYGGWPDAVLMRIVEALLAIPPLVLLLLLSRPLAGNATVVVLFGRQLSITAVVIVIIIGLTSWMRLSRIIRAQVLSLKEQDFVSAARVLGAGNRRIIFGHILPNCIAPIVVAATLEIGAAIITEAYLSFLGFGVLPPTATWGNILTRSRDVLDIYPWMWIAPGALIVITTLAINFIGDGLRDALDPRMRGV
jgi:peptide/nickel transport system permease protein